MKFFTNSYVRHHPWLRSHLLAIIGITAVAALLRFINLTGLPTGFHGDEAVAGIEGARILREGSIGPYSPLALGQPTGPLYLTAIGVKLWGHSILATRFFSALLGTLCVPLLHSFLRAHINRETALLGAGLLAITGWHIHFSRIGFPLISWPLCATLAMWALFEALQRRQWNWFALAGAACGLGIYSYNAHVVFIATEFIFLLFALWRQCEVPLRTRLLWFAVFAATLLVVASPMLRFALDSTNDYFSHAKLLSIFATSSWQEQNGWGEQILFLTSRYVHYWSGLVWAPELNYGDGTGTTPFVPPALAALTLVGVAFALRRRQNVAEFALLLMAMSPLSAVVTVEGTSRRTFVVVLSIAILAAFGLVETYKMLVRRRAYWKPTFVSALALWVLGISLVEMKNYFLLATRSQHMNWVFCRDLEESIVWMNALPAKSSVLFFSERWSFDYEPRVFLAPDINGENRSKEFGQFNLYRDSRLQHPTAWVLLGNYREQLVPLQQLYPGGKVVRGSQTTSDGQPTFIGYYISS